MENALMQRMPGLRRQRKLRQGQTPVMQPPEVGWPVRDTMIETGDWEAYLTPLDWHEARTGWGEGKSTMKHVEAFAGCIVSAIASLGYDADKVLAACNSWRGSQKADSAKGSLKTSAKLSGRVLKSGEDKRTVRLTDSEKSVSVANYSPAGALLALSDSIRDLESRHGVSVGEIVFPAEIADWLARDTFKPDAE